MDCLHLLEEFAEGLFTDAVQDFRLVAEVKVDRSGSVLDFVRDLANGDALVALLYEQRARRIQDFLPETFLLSRASLLASHILNTVHFKETGWRCQQQNSGRCHALLALPHARGHAGSRTQRSPPALPSHRGD